MSSLAANRLAQSRVRSSAQRLDRDQPHWYTIVDLVTLDMDDSGSCVLGQLHPDGWATWPELLEAVGLTVNDACRRGFMVGDELAAASDELTYELLELCWRREITKRRKANTFCKHTQIGD